MRHVRGCDVEQCAECGNQAISCGCPGDYFQFPRLPWTGQWPGEAECRKFGWFAKLVPGKGWVRCAESDPDSHPDIGRLRTGAYWHARTATFVQGAPDRSESDEDDALGWPEGAVPLPYRRKRRKNGKRSGRRRGGSRAPKQAP